MSNEPVPTNPLGSGWSFPPQFLASGGAQGGPPGYVVMTTDEVDIDASLRILFGTARGERFLNPAYGLDMHDLMFDAMGTTVKTYLEDRITRAILIYEPRVRVVSLEVDVDRADQGKLQIALEYEVQSTNSRYNLVYPFYTQDGSELRAALGLGTTPSQPVPVPVPA